MSKVIFVCNTPFQCLTSIIIKYTLFNNDFADVIITDHINNSSTVVSNFKSVNFFENIYHVTLRPITKEKKWISKFNMFLSTMFPNFLMNRVKLNYNKYDYLFVHNMEAEFENSLYYFMHKSNSNLKVCLFDEGYSTYTSLFTKPNLSFMHKNIRKLSKMIYKRKEIFEVAKDLYLFDPDLICCDMLFNIIKIQVPQMDEHSEILEILNKSFDYNPVLNDEYNEKVIFFEESFYYDRGYRGDEIFVNDISKIIGKDDMRIKLHPRNKEDRFTTLGYKTNTKIIIPWELIAINLPNSNKVFVSFSSGAVLSYKMLVNKNFKTILLYKCIGNEFIQMNDNTLKWFEKFEIKYGDNIFVPLNKTELKELLYDI